MCARMGKHWYGYAQMVMNKFKIWKKSILPRKGKELLPLVKDSGTFLRESRNLAAREAVGSRSLQQHAKVHASRTYGFVQRHCP